MLGGRHNDAQIPPAQILWGKTCQHLQREIGAEKFASWVKPLHLVEVNGKAVHLAAPNAFCRDWVQENLGRKLTRAWQTFDPQGRAIFVKVVEGQNAPDAQLADAAPALMPEAGASADANAAQPAPLSDPPGQKSTNTGFDDFVIDSSNEVAYAVARQVSQGNTAGFNPFFVHGGYGVGKTHLLRAIADSPLWVQPSKRVLFLTAEEFVYDFVSAVRERQTHKFKAKMRALDLLLIDDLQFMGGKDASQDEFFHTLSALTSAGAQVVLSADNAPGSLGGLDPRLLSRITGGLVCEIGQSSLGLRRQILERRVDLLSREYRGLAIPSAVLDMIAEEICTNPRELIGALNTVLARTALIGQPVNEDRCREILGDIMRDPSRKVSIAQIQNAVAAYYDLSLEQLLSRRRTRNIVRPRQIAMYLSKHMTTCSLPMIGGRFEGRDHATVIHADKQIASLMTSDPVLAADVKAIRRELMLGTA
ncbi:MAG: chromosomal replication initiator protein DnaA [Robiginitomaculum sp.]|nr:chromosomal replication initiator protein DnaA [Robiginitomaculum sp.]MDQ7077878.1 chromosomal replication initiator protein DnaA [Robiginitomaculum sp.]